MPMATLAGYLSGNSISPMREMGAYEALWAKTNATFKRLAEKFRSRPDAVPSDFVSPVVADKFAQEAIEVLKRAKVVRFGVRVHGAGEYPVRLREALYPVELLYYQGWWDLVESRCVAVVGTRTPSLDAVKRTKALVGRLVGDGFTIVSGLAKGIDTVAHETAITEGGLTIAVIGTALSRAYPSQNRALQERISEEYLLISQVPVIRSAHQGPAQNRIFFPERNVTMSALTQATIIVEAGDTSGTLVQANAALKQGRKLFILDSCFRNPALTWPARLQAHGAIRVREYDEIAKHLAS